MGGMFDASTTSSSGGGGCALGLPQDLGRSRKGSLEAEDLDMASSSSSTSSMATASRSHRGTDGFGSTHKNIMGLVVI